MNASTFFLLCALCSASPLGSRAFTHADVDPFIGTGKAGNTYPGAQAPFGMLSWSPNTTFEDYDSVLARPGYKYDHPAIFGFSVTHVSGVGCHVAQDLPIMPVSGPLLESPLKSRDVYSSRFDHAQERARPGSYDVFLKDPQVHVSLSATERAGMGRFTFPTGKQRSLIFRPSQSANGVTATVLKIDVAQRQLSGILLSGGFCDRDPKLYPYVLYFVADFDQPITAHGFWKGEALSQSEEAEGADVAAFVSFNESTPGPVRMRIGLSYTSLTNAVANLASEIPGWDAQAVRKRTQERWDSYLTRLDASASPALRTMLATALYHNLLQPSVFDDVSGEYTGYDLRRHEIAKGHHKYVNFSNWDTYRTSAQLQALVCPQEASDMAESLRLDNEQAAPAGFPIWGLYNHETWVMNGYSAVPWIANAFAFGAKDYDAERMKAALILAAETHYPRGALYQRLGYVPLEKGPYDFSVSQSVEYAIDDFALSRLCRALGDSPNGDRLEKRAQSPFRLLDPVSKQLRPRLESGVWHEPFTFTDELGFNEGNSAHYTWSVPQNIARLVEEVGGAKRFEARLDAFFGKILVDGWNTQEPYFWVSNEPCFGTPLLYHWLGKPWKTNDVLQRVLREFNETPDGLPGDDDVGAMSAYELWIALGLYPAIPGSGGFLVTTPAVDSFLLPVPDGKTLRVQTVGTATRPAYIQSMELNGKPVLASWVTLAKLAEKKENTLILTLGKRPGSEWGVKATNRPPSFNAASR